MDPARTPVIVGVGELLERPADPALARPPQALMAAALRLAEADAGARLLPDLDHLVTVHQASWPSPRTPWRVADLVGARPARAEETPVGGHQPLAALQAAAAAIAEGRARVAAVAGAEAEQTVSQARRAGRVPPWPAEPPVAPAPRAAAAQQPLVRQLGADRPAHVYPLYENALPAARGTTPAAEQARSAALWSRLSAVAASRPAAWLTRPLSAEQILRAGPDNRPVAWPYPKLMTANPAVNQGAALLLTSLERARALGLDAARLVHLHGGAAAREPDDILARDGYGRCAALEAVLAAAVELAGGRAFDLLELYSCFPVVPKLALAALGLADEAAISVAGGLTFFGAPLNNYMTHAAVAMVQRLRARPGALGLLYGQGGWLTAHHALLLSAEPAKTPATLDCQAAAAARRGPVPPLDLEHRGPAALETFTLLHERDGAVRQGIAICRSPAGARLIARIAGAGGGTLARLTDPLVSPVGAAGRVSLAQDGFPEWRHAA